MSGEDEQFGRSGADEPMKIGQFQWNQTDADGRSYDLSTTLETLNENKNFLKRCQKSRVKKTPPTTIPFMIRAGI